MKIHVHSIGLKKFRRNMIQYDIFSSVLLILISIIYAYDYDIHDVAKRQQGHSKMPTGYQKIMSADIAPWPMTPTPRNRYEEKIIFYQNQFGDKYKIHYINLNNQRCMLYFTS